MKKISIITVVYNDKIGLEKTINSVLSQSFNSIEYIIVDGGSTDGSVDVIKKYQNRIDKWVSEPDEGIYDAMNKGIKMASGEWLNFMNAGDVFTGIEVVSKISFYLDANDIQIVYGNIIRIYSTHMGRKYPIRKTQIDVVDFIIGNIDHQASFIRKSLFIKYGVYDTTYRLAADHYFFLKVVGIYKEKCKYLDLDIVYFAMNGKSSKQKHLYSEEKEIMYKKEFGYFYDNLKELSEYRVSGILRGLLKIRIAIKKTGFNKIVRNILNYRMKFKK